MNHVLGQNIAKYRKLKKYTQEDLAQLLHITYQAISKWETGLSVPDAALIPGLAYLLDTDINALFGYVYDAKEKTIYENAYDQAAYYWGTSPSPLCYRVLEALPPTKPLRLLDVCCGEGRNAVFFARNGYSVTAFDVASSGLDKTKRLADIHNVSIKTIKADINDFFLDTEFDIIFSTGALHYIIPDRRDDIIENYISHTSAGGLNVLNVFIHKPFIPSPPEPEPLSFPWRSGELFTYYSDWKLQQAEELIFDCDSSGIPHQHCINQMLAEKIVSRV